MISLGSAGGVDVSAVPRVIWEGVGQVANGTATGSYIIAATTVNPYALANGNAYLGVFGFDPADYAVAGKTTQVSLIGSAKQPAGSQAASVAAALYPVTAISVGGNPTLGTVVCSAALMAAAAAQGSYRVRSSWVTAPATGLFVVTVDMGTALSTGGLGVEARLELKHV